MSISPKLDKVFKYYGMEKPSKELNSLQGNAKSKKSVISKLKRKIEISSQTEYKVADIKDLSRCAVLLDTFSDAVQFIKNLKEVYPNLKGDISRNNTGYKGIHLNTSINGVIAEIQISTKNAWTYKMAGEEFYTKWRDFDEYAEKSKIKQMQLRLESLKAEYQSKPHDELKADIDNLSVEIVGLQNELNEKINLKNHELLDTQEMFDELFSSSDFNNAEREIESLLLSYDLLDANEVAMTQETQSNKNILSTPIELMEDGKVDIEKNSEHLDKCINIANQVQSMLEENVRAAIKNYTQENLESSDKEKNVAQTLILDIMQEYDARVAEYFKQSDFAKVHSLEISEQRTYIASTVAKFAASNDLLGSPCLEVLDTFYEAIRGNAAIKPNDMLSIERMVKKTLAAENKLEASETLESE